MAERSGFFNALFTNGAYDRKYNANDYSNNLAAVISNGVLRDAENGLRVTASGMTVTVAAGRAWIAGKWYHNDAPLSFAVPTAPAGGNRIDRVILRLDTAVAERSITLRYVQGTAANNPTAPAPVRSGSIYELVLADVFVATNATSAYIIDTRGDAQLCGWVYSTAGDNSFFVALDNSFKAWFTEKKDTLSSVTLFKRYTWRTVFDAASNVAVFDVPQWDENTCFLEVYVNGILVVEGTNYTRNGNILTFANSLVAETEIVVKVYKSIDGTGIQTVADEITELQNAVAAMKLSNEYTYTCNGVDDNVKLSQIAQAWLDGGNDNGNKKITVVGTFGAQAAYSGSGTASSPYRWFAIGSDAAKTRRITFDFSNCSEIELPIADSTVNHVFTGKNAHIIGVAIRAFSWSTNSVVRVFDSKDGAVYAENCYFNIYAAQNCGIAYTGTFVNCRGVITNLDGDSYCFNPQSNSLLRVKGGEYTAYTGSTSHKSAIVGQISTTAVSILDGVNAPTIAYANQYQTHALYQASGAGNMNCRDLVTLLPVAVVSGNSNIQGTIARSKAGNM